MRHLNLHYTQRGSFLLEALIAMLIFTLGVLGLVALQGTGIAANTDVRYRVEAVRMADRMMSEIRGGLQRNATTGEVTTDPTTFNHYADNDACTATTGFSGNASSLANVQAWDLALRTTASTSLPNPTNLNWYQIRITPPTGAITFTQVRIAICWQQPGLDVPRCHVLTGAIS